MVCCPRPGVADGAVIGDWHEWPWEGEAPDQVLPAAWSDGRPHVADATCWCGPEVRHYQSSDASSEAGRRAVIVHQAIEP